MTAEQELALRDEIGRVLFAFGNSLVNLGQAEDRLLALALRVLPPIPDEETQALAEHLENSHPSNWDADKIVKAGRLLGLWASAVAETRRTGSSECPPPAVFTDPTPT